MGDDATPFEFSLALSPKGRELRILIEPLGSEPTTTSNAQAALTLLESLADDYAIDLRRLRTISDLYLPTDIEGRLALWVAVTFSTTSNVPEFKLYLNPEAQGIARAPALVEETLSRLGFPAAWPVVAESIVRRGPMLDQLKYVSLDLDGGPQSRLKIYALHNRPSFADMERAAAAAAHYRAGEVTQFLRAVAPPGVELLAGRGLSTCLSFVEGEQVPRAATIHFPINGYAENDEAIRQRVGGYLRQVGLDAELYSTALSQYATRPLADQIGMQSYVSMRCTGGEPRITIYLPAEAYAPGTVAQPVVMAAPTTHAEIVRRYEDHEPITLHPFMQRLRREPVNLNRLWILMANFHMSISRHFARHLARLVGRIDDARILSVLVEQLNDELGRGDHEQAHTNLFLDMMAKLEPWRPRSTPPELFRAGERLTPKLAAIYGAADPNEAVGAMMAGEVFGKQLDLFIGEEFRRQHELDAKSLEWLTLHEELEVEHAGGSLVLAGLLPPEALEATWRGGYALARAGWEFLDDLYATCFGLPVAHPPLNPQLQDAPPSGPRSSSAN